MTDARYIDAARVAEQVRKRLRAHFTGTKFRVRTSRYSGGSSIDVSWTDGPARERVEDVVGWMHGCTFDGMTDSTRYHDSELDGEKVHFGNSYIFCERRLSDAAYNALVSETAAKWGFDMAGAFPPAPAEGRLEGWASQVRVAGEYLSTLAWRELGERGRAELEEHKAHVERVTAELLDQEQQRIAAVDRLRPSARRASPALGDALAELEAYARDLDADPRDLQPGPETDPLTAWVEL